MIISTVSRVRIYDRHCTITQRMMRTMKLRSPGIVALTAISASLIVSPTGVAQANELVEEYSVTEQTQGLESTLTIKFAKPLPRQSAKSQVESLVDSAEPNVAPTHDSSRTTTQASKSKIFKLKCSTPFGQIDSNGHIEMQHKCGSNKTPWGFWINENLQKRITGKVKERGMDSTVAGKRQGRQSDHKVDKNYHFHGTFTAKDNQTINYSDKFSFPVGLDIGTMKIAGKVKFTS